MPTTVAAHSRRGRREVVPGPLQLMTVEEPDEREPEPEAEEDEADDDWKG